MLELPAGWVFKRFQDLLVESRNGIYKKKEFHGHGVRMVNMGELFAYDYISNQDMKLIELTESEKDRFLLKDGDLLFARRSLVLEGSGKCSIVISPQDEITFESSIIRTRPNKLIAHPKFYFYFFKSSIGRNLVMSIASRTGVSGIRGTELVELKVIYPPLETQRKIAAILSAYDDAIENNTRRIKALEEAAQALYREWFVEFRYPGHEDVPLVDSELGMIPQGWEVSTLGDCIELSYGKGLRKSDRVAGEYPVYGSSGIIDSHNEYLIEGPGIIVGRKGNVGSVFWSNAPFYPIDTTYYVITDFSLYYVYYDLLYQPFVDTHAAVPGLNRDMAYSLSFLIPPQSLINRFDLFISNNLATQRNLTKQNDILRKARDRLLPRLVAGEVDVSALDVV